MTSPISCSTPRAGWAAYWDQDRFWSSSDLWKIQARIFFHRARRFIQWEPTDVVADIGCGPGFLAMQLAPHVKAIHGFDVAPSQVERFVKNCRHLPNVQVSRLGEDYTDLSDYGERFSLFLCVSVVQYYRNPDEMEALIRSAQATALPGARMLIADLPLRRSLSGCFLDFSSSLLLSLREGYTPSILKAVLLEWPRLSEYRSFCEENPSLFFSADQIQGLIRRMRLNATIIREALSIHASRPSVLIQFP